MPCKMVVAIALIRRSAELWALESKSLTMRRKAMIFCSSGAGPAWELLREGESLYVGCQGEATRCGKLWQMIFEPQGGYRRASFVLAAELFFATLNRGTAVVAAPLPEGRYGPGG